MIIRVVLPKSGMGIDEGTIIRWLKAEGETVAEGEVLAEVETAKATQEVESPARGRLVQILVGVGEAVEVNNDIAIIEREGD